MNELTFSIITFIVIYLFYLFFVILRKKKLERFKKNVYISFLVKIYGLDLSKINFLPLAHVIALTNAGIISATLFLVSIVPNLILKMLLAILILIPLQFFMYYVIGKIYQKKCRKKE